MFYKELEKNNSKYAIHTSLKINESEISFPILLKPRRGYASRNIVIVEDKNKLELYRSEIGSNLMIQPVIGSVEEEYTVSAFFNNTSKLCAYMSLKRKLSKEGYTETAQTVEIDNIEKALLELNRIFKPVGPTNFQFRKNNDQLKLLEINPRISSATSIRASFGYNESLMSVEYFLNNIQPTQPKMKTGHAVRYVEDMIFYDSNNF